MDLSFSFGPPHRHARACAAAMRRFAMDWCSLSCSRLTFDGLQGVEHWKKFYSDSKKYWKVGRVTHPSIDPASPYPEHCDPKKAQAAKERQREAGAGAQKHEEL